MFRIALLFTLAVTVAQAQEGVKPFSSKEGKFSVKFAGTPKEQTQPTAGTKMYMFVLEAKEGAYLAAYADLPIPGGETAKELQTRLDGARDGMITNMKGKLTDEKKLTLAKQYPGREIFADLPMNTGQVRARVYFVDKRLYQVMVIGNKDFVQAKATEAFLDSFELTK